MQDTLQRNSCSENILLTLLYDSDMSIRELAIKRIIRARNEIIPGIIHTFVIPKMNCEAKKYYGMID